MSIVARCIHENYTVLSFVKTVQTFSVIFTVYQRKQQIFSRLQEIKFLSVYKTVCLQKHESPVT